MMPAFWNARTVFGGLCLVAIAGSLATYPHPEYSIGYISAVLVLATFPSLLALGAIVWSRETAEKIVPAIWWITTQWYIVSIPAAILLGLNNNAFRAVFAIVLQIAALPLFVSTRDPMRLHLLRSIVRSGLAMLALCWICASLAFAGFVRLAAANTAGDAPYCLFAPSPGYVLSSTALPSHLDLLLFQRTVAYPEHRDLARYRLVLTVYAEDGEEQFHLSFTEWGFAPGGDRPTPADCESAKRRS